MAQDLRGALALGDTALEILIQHSHFVLDLGAPCNFSAQRLITTRVLVRDGHLGRDRGGPGRWTGS